MRRTGVLVSIVFGALLVGGTSFAQQGSTGSQMPQAPPHGGHGGMCPMMASGTCPMMGGGMQGGMMGGGMMGMGQMGNSPQALQMRGEMMKAMGDVMIKHGQMMEKAAKP
jgi:hypothetical protein